MPAKQSSQARTNTKTKTTARTNPEAKAQPEARTKAQATATSASASTIQPTYVRPSWDEYFIEIMDAVSRRATCDRGRSGCIIVRDNVILSTGYVGAPKGSPHCDDVGHLMKKMIHDDGHISEHCKRTTHAEANAICQAAKNGISIDGATVYCRMTPCRDCAMLIANSGITKVVAQRDYHDSAESKVIFNYAGVKLTIIHSEVQKY